LPTALSGAKMAGLTRFLAMGGEFDPQYRWRATATWSINGVSLKWAAFLSGTGKFYVDSPTSNFTLGTIRQARLWSHGAGTFTMWTTDSSKPSDTIIRGLGFAHYADAALIVGAPRVRLRKHLYLEWVAGAPSRE